MAFSGDIDNIYIVDADTENKAVQQIKDTGGFVTIVVNIDKAPIPYSVFKTCNPIPGFNEPF